LDQAVESEPLYELPSSDGRWRSNERIAASARSHHFDDVTAIPFICECVSADCSELLRLTLTEFAAARRLGRYLIAPGHHVEGTRHLHTERTYWIVDEGA
jgi:hypothetical protein